MQRPVINVPDQLMRTMQVDWSIDWRGQQSGEVNAGTTQTVYNAFPRWVGSPTWHLRRQDILTWRAIRSAAQGRVGIYRLPLIDPLGFSSAFDLKGIPFSNDMPFSHGLGFSYRPYVTAATSAARGSTSLRVDVTGAGDLVPVQGQLLSHNDWPFLVVSVCRVSALIYNLNIQMHLRDDVAAGDRIDLRAFGLFEAVEEGMGNPAYGRDHRARPQMSFREVLSR